MDLINELRRVECGVALQRHTHTVEFFHIGQLQLTDIRAAAVTLFQVPVDGQSTYRLPQGVMLIPGFLANRRVTKREPGGRSPLTIISSNCWQAIPFSEEKGSERWFSGNASTADSLITDFTITTYV